jgi:type IX secretion system PorP/SprF family membrane protein
MNTIKYFVVIWSLFFCLLSHAQQETLYTQYIFSQMTVNPAYAGNDDGLSLTSLSRKQWLGLKGSPTTFSLIGHMPLSDYNTECRVSTKDGLIPMNYRQAGLGIVVFNDKIGVNNTFLSSFAYSYKIKFSPGTRLSFGLQVSLLNFTQMFNQLDNPNTNDAVFQNNINVTRFNAGTGVFYESDRYYVGFSVPEIIENKLNPQNTSDDTQLRQYFLTGGYVFYLNSLYKFKPTILLRYTEGMPLQFDINAHFLYRDKVWLGCSYRYNSSINVMTELLLTDNFRFGLAYDYLISEINVATQGSVEVMLNYIFQNTKKRVINPRHF